MAARSMFIGGVEQRLIRIGRTRGHANGDDGQFASRIEQRINQYTAKASLVIVNAQFGDKSPLQSLKGL
jgi:poly-gamma-glutamate capsule biosynthesis protein CapA/YwtB (metallophosphatase superfamily)